MAEPKVDIRNGWTQSEGQRKKSGSVRGGRGGRPRAVISDEICATVKDHVLVQGNAMSGEGQGAQPNQGIQKERLIVSLWSLKVLEVSEFGTAQSCFAELPRENGRTLLPSQQQEALTVNNMLLQNKAIRRWLTVKSCKGGIYYEGTKSIRLTIDRVLHRNMKQPFEQLRKGQRSLISSVHSHIHSAVDSKCYSTLLLSVNWSA